MFVFLGDDAFTLKAYLLKLYPLQSLSLEKKVLSYFCEIIFRGDLFADANFANILRGFISVDGEILIILRGLIFAVSRYM